MWTQILLYLPGGAKNQKGMHVVLWTRHTFVTPLDPPELLIGQHSKVTSSEHQLYLRPCRSTERMCYNTPLKIKSFLFLTCLSWIMVHMTVMMHIHLREQTSRSPVSLFFVESKLKTAVCSASVKQKEHMYIYMWDHVLPLAVCAHPVITVIDIHIILTKTIHKSQQ